jgi:hypothetical protein
MGAIAARTQTDATGWYTVSIPPGDYVVHVASTTPLPRCPDEHVVVAAANSTRVDLSCDTGIR